MDTLEDDDIALLRLSRASLECMEKTSDTEHRWSGVILWSFFTVSIICIFYG